MVKLLTSNFRLDAIRIMGFRSMKLFKNVSGLFENILRKFIIKRTVVVINKLRQRNSEQKAEFPLFYYL
jgi:hypothetical protein